MKPALKRRNTHSTGLKSRQEIDKNSEYRYVDEHDGDINYRKREGISEWVV